MFDSSAPSRRVDVSTPPFAKQIFLCEQESEAATNSHAKGCERTCPRQDSNLYALSGTGPSNQPVYQFQHVGSARLRKPAMLEEGLEPSRGCPHRILNPARLPIPPPEQSVPGVGDVARMEPRGVEPLTS